MRLLQSPPSFKAAMAGAVLVFGILPAAGSAGETEGGPPPQPLFSCGTDSGTDAGFLSIDAVELAFGTWDDLRFERRANGSGEVIYSFPRAGTDYKTAFLFSHSNGEGGYLVSIRWTDGGTDFVLYSLDAPPEGDEVAAGEAGLAISRDGALVERVACVERPYMFIDYLRGNMSCDTQSPYGPAACEEDSAERTTPLDTGSIGIVP